MMKLILLSYYQLTQLIKFSKHRTVFENNSSVNVKLSKTQLRKIVQSGGFLSRLLGLLGLIF